MTLPRDFILLPALPPGPDRDFLLALAARLPQQPFVLLAADPGEVEGRAQDLAPVTLWPRPGDPAALCRAARAVVVRGVPEDAALAQRAGRPVLALAGAAPPGPGLVLPPDPALWAAEIARLAGAPAAAPDPSPGPRPTIRRLVDAVDRPLLVAIGSGVGNMLHTGPMIRRIAAQVGHPVDIVVSQDHRDSLFLLQDPRHVHAVFALNGLAMDRRYDTVFVTHCFGSERLPFRARRVIWSRDWDMFFPGHALHETVFNLEAARALLGVDYTPDDIRRHYVSDLPPIPARPAPAGDRGLVGLHGGSKGGFWASKRWPHFPALAQALKAKGYRVASFGIAEEYVPGTEDRTGGSLRDMALALRDCRWFVSNDSGVMNLANALDIPLLALFGPTNWRTRGPLGGHSRSLPWDADRPACECSAPKTFAAGLCTCIDKIPLDRVIAAFERMVAGTAGDTPAPGVPALAL